MKDSEISPMLFNKMELLHIVQKKTIKYLSRKVKLLLNEVKWRANSPNLKVIETLWAIIKAKIYIDNIQNSDDLFKEVQKIWDETPLSTINLLIDSFKSRVQTCIRIKGESLNGKKKSWKNFRILMKLEIII